MVQDFKDHVQLLKEDLVEEITALCGESSLNVVETLYREGLLNSTSTRNYLIRRDFDKALVGKVELIKHIFLDLSDKYDMSVRQVQRIVYDHVRTKCQ
tara:strand:- start:1312 stop:1605 length:294 start_codon:yes stop_codon:yes gene_type:complete